MFRSHFSNSADFGLQASIPFRHPQRFASVPLGPLNRIRALLEETPTGLMPEIVKSESIWRAGSGFDRVFFHFFSQASRNTARSQEKTPGLNAGTSPTGIGRFPWARICLLTAPIFQEDFSDPAFPHPFATASPGPRRPMPSSAPKSLHKCFGNVPFPDSPAKPQGL